MTINTHEDEIHEPDGPVTFTLLAGTGYDIGDPGSATVQVEDDGPVPTERPAKAQIVLVARGVEKLVVQWRWAARATDNKVQWKAQGQGYDPVNRQAIIPQGRSGLGFYTIGNLNPNMEYTVRVIATNVVGDADPSDEVANTPLSSLDPLTGLTVTPRTGGALALSWDPVEGAGTTYDVQWKSGAQEYNRGRLRGTRSTSYTLGCLNPGTEYTVRVTAFHSYRGRSTPMEKVATPRGGGSPRRRMRGRIRRWPRAPACDSTAAAETRTAATGWVRAGPRYRARR